MNRLIIDYLRRWRWAYLVVALGMTVFWFALMAGADRPGIFPLAFYLGAFLLAFDLMKGSATTITVMPLSRVQIGKSWWLVATVIPTVVSFLTRLIAIGIAWTVLRKNVFDLEWLSLSVL